MDKEKLSDKQEWDRMSLANENLVKENQTLLSHNERLEKENDELQEQLDELQAQLDRNDDNLTMAYMSGQADARDKIRELEKDKADLIIACRSACNKYDKLEKQLKEKG